MSTRVLRIDRTAVVVAAVMVAVIMVASSIPSNAYAVSVVDEYVFDFEFDSRGSVYGEFNRPHSVAYDPNNNRIIVADTYNHRVQVFSP